jgi:integrase
MGKGYFRVEEPKGFHGNQARRSVYCRTRNAANELRAAIKDWKRQRYAPTLPIVVLSESDRNWLGYLKNRLGSLDRLPEIVDHWERTKGAPINKTLVASWRVQFLAAKETETNNRRTLSDIKYRLTQFSDKFGQEFIDEIDEIEVRKFLDSVPRGYSRRNSYKWVSLGFKWAKQQRMLVVDPFDTIDRPEAGWVEPGILTPGDFATLLTTADAKFPKLVPFLACAGFAGLRVAELTSMYANEQTLQWPDVMFDRELIVIRGEVAKQTRRESGDRRFVKIEPALRHWLEPHRKNEGAVVQFTESWLRKQLRRLYAAAGVAPVDNGLRHSFASYWLARTGADGVGRLAVQLGNSEAVARKHYIESLMPGDGDAWFKIRRAA